MPANPFPKGNKLAKGGVRPGAGRPPSKVKEFARKKSLEAMKRIWAIGNGVALDHTLEGKKVRLPGSLSEQRRAMETVLKVADELGPDIAIPASAVNLLDSIEEARKNRGLPL